MLFLKCTIAWTLLFMCIKQMEINEKTTLERLCCKQLHVNHSLKGLCDFTQSAVLLHGGTMTIRVAYRQLYCVWLVEKSGWVMIHFAAHRVPMGSNGQLYVFYIMYNNLNSVTLINWSIKGLVRFQIKISW